MKPPATLFLLNTLCVGGSEKKTILLANALCARNERVHVAYLNQPDTLLDELAVAVPRIYLRRSGKFGLRALWRLREYVARESIRHIVSINLHPALYAAGIKLLAGRQAPRCVMTVNTTTFHDRREARFMALYRHVLRRADRVIFGCQTQQHNWVRGYGLDPHRCMHIYNGIDPAKFSQDALADTPGQLRQRHKVAADEIVIGSVGQFRPEKQQSDLLHAVSTLQQRGLKVRALLVGTGPQESLLRAVNRELGLDGSTLLLGQLADVRPALKMMDIFALTSTSVETFSNAALEAMSMALPVVLSDIGGAREMVSPGVDGLLYPAGDVAALVHALETLARKPQDRARLGQAARGTVEQRFAFNRVTDAYAQMLREPEDL